MRSLLLLALLGCGATTKPPLPPPCPACPDLDAPEALSGVWVDQDTQTFLIIGAVAGRVVSLFVIDDDGEVEPVSNVGWDGTTLTFTAFIPSTGYTLSNTLRLAGADALVGSHTGSHTGDGDVWKRRQTGAARP